MYRNKQHAKLAALIRKNHLPSDPNIDWSEVYRYWLKGHKKERPKKVWTEEEKYKTRAYMGNRRARLKGQDGIVTADDLREIMNKYRKQCNHCGKRNNLVFDHIIPYYRGGHHAKDNLQVLCRLCNMEKGVNA